MDTSVFLQFDYCIENKVVRNDIKKFAENLGNLFEQYKKVCIENYKYQKSYENAVKKVPFQVFECKSDNSNVALRTSPKNSTTYNLDTRLGLNETPPADDKFVQNQIINENLLLSPVLVKGSRFKKKRFTPSHSTLHDTNEIDTPSLLREDVTILANSFDENLSTFVETKENQCSIILNNKDEVECRPLSRLPKRMGPRKPYNVGTTLLNSGKNLKQSRLPFVPSEESKMTINKKKHKKLTTLIQPEFLTSRKNLQKNIEVSRSNEVVDKEIIKDKLQKYENAVKKVPFQVFECKSDNSNVVLQTSPENSTTYNWDTRLGLNETPLADDKFVQNQIVNEKLLCSPVLVKGSRFKKKRFTPGHSTLHDTNEIDTPSLLREDITILANSFDENLSTFVETKENQCSTILNNKDEVECRPLSRLPKRMGLRKPYNVGTTLLNSGKNLKQSRLPFVSSEESKIQYTDIMRRKFNSFIDTRITNPSQCSNGHTSIPNELYSVNQLKSFNTSQNKSVKNNNEIIPSPSFSVHMNVNTKRIANNVPTEEAEKIYTKRTVNKSEEETENIDNNNKSQTQERKSSKLVEETISLASSDETFYLLGEILQGKLTSEVVCTKISNNNISENVSHKSSDVPYEEEDIVNCKTRNVAESGWYQLLEM
ncbi:uncharacterized protein LOC144471979 [Augochlora pura]